MSKPSFSEWFCLKDGHKNFQIDPVRDQEFLFGEPAWEKDIDSRLKRSQLLGTPLRLVWYGQFGIGKTHRLRHTLHLIEKNNYRYFPRYVVASDIQEKTGFERLHYELVNSLGRDFMKEIVESFILKARTGTNPDMPSLDEICGTSTDVKAAIQNFGSGIENPVLPSWRFLCGLKLESADLRLAGVTKDRLDSSNEFAAVLGALANIIQYETGGKELIYLIDEAENLTKITNKTAAARWQESLRSIADLQNLSIVLTIGAEKLDGLPAVVLQPDIVRRFQRDNYIQMASYNQPTASNFVRDMLVQWVDPAKRATLEASQEMAESESDYDSDLYPFTRSGFDQFCEYATVDPRTAKPSEIIARLNNVAAEAYFGDKRLITSGLLTELGMG